MPPASASKAREDAKKAQKKAPRTSLEDASKTRLFDDVMDVPAWDTPALRLPHAELSVVMPITKKKKSKNKFKRHLDEEKEEEERPSAIATSPPAPLPSQPHSHQKSNQKKRQKTAAHVTTTNKALEMAVISAPTKATTTMVPPTTTKKASSQGGLDAMLASMRNRLAGGRFRQLNEFLYTSSGAEALRRFQGDTSLFAEYHEGYRAMAAKWPASKAGGGAARPAHAAAAFVKGVVLPRRAKDKVVVADLGCGDAELHATLGPVGVDVRSFDLFTAKPCVVAADIANLRDFLDDACVDVAVFCLALMGTDYAKAITEACRVAKPGGYVYIVEVRSRFPEATKQQRDDGASASKANKAKAKAAKRAIMEGTSLVHACERNLGLVNVTHLHANTPAVMPNDFFVTLIFQKKANAGVGAKSAVPWPTLKACEYKRR